MSYKNHIHQSVPGPIVPQLTLRMRFGDASDHVMLEKTGRAVVHRKLDITLSKIPLTTSCEPEGVHQLTAGPKLEYAVTVIP